MQKTPFSENVAIVTGASSGIGRELALQLADQGAWLALAARRAEALGEVAAQCRQRGGRALVVPTDVTQPAQCENLVARTVAEYRRIDTLFNNAGIATRARFDEIRDLALIEQIMRVNYLGSVACTYYALPHLKQTKGRIVGICSAAGKWGLPKVSAYSASKHAMAGFFDSLRIELADCGVSVTMIYPGSVATRGRQASRAIMPVETCVRAIVKAAAQRKRELVMPFIGRVGLWFKLIAPRLLDRYVAGVMESEN
jgi:short-subunit dehydrogenase